LFLKNFNLEINYKKLKDEEFKSVCVQIINNIATMSFHNFFSNFNDESTNDINTKEEECIDIFLYFLFNDYFQDSSASNKIIKHDIRSILGSNSMLLNENIIKKINENLEEKIFNCRNENYEINFKNINLSFYNLLVVIQKYSNIIEPVFAHKMVSTCLNYLQTNGKEEFKELSIDQMLIFQCHHILLFNVLHYFFETFNNEISSNLSDILKLLGLVDSFYILMNHDHIKIYICFILDTLNCPQIIGKLGEHEIKSMLMALNNLFLKIHNKRNIISQLEFDDKNEELIRNMENLKKYKENILECLPINQVNELSYFQTIYQTHSDTLIKSKRRLQQSDYSSLDNRQSFSKEQSLIIISIIESLPHLNLARSLYHHPKNNSNIPRIILNII
jgi:hypothetical protein